MAGEKDAMIKATLKGVRELRRELAKEAASAEKDFTTAVKVEGFRLRTLLIADIRKAAPAGSPFKILSELARRTGSRNVQGSADIRMHGRSGTLSRPRNARQALRRLALAVRYNVVQNPFAFHVGWTGPKVSKSWKRLAEIHQEGFSRNVTEAQRRMFARRGGELKGKWRKGGGRSGAWEWSANPAVKYFFLRKGTTKMTTPARPIISPFWAAHERESWHNIRDNFRRKRRGERI